MKKNVLLIVIIFLTLVGVVNSSFIFAKAGNGQPLPCFFVNGCEIVQNSIYAKIFGIPLSLLGIIYYAILAISTSILLRYVSSLATKHKPLIMSWFLYVVMGFLFSLYLLYLQAFIIGAFCSSCLLSLGDMIITMTIAFVFCRNLRKDVL